MLEIHDLIIRWTIRIAILFYAIRVLSDAKVGDEITRSKNSVRIYWSLGCLLNLIHLAVAFYWFHELSHHHAYQHTAKRTAEVTGIEWGGGIYFNYLFGMFWLIDTFLWWNHGLEWPYKHPKYLIAIHALFAFIVFNATAVFGPYFWRYIIPLLYFAAAFNLWFSINHTQKHSKK